jgi:hypothetical protein
MSLKYVEQQLWQGAYATGVGDALVLPQRSAAVGD